MDGLDQAIGRAESFEREQTDKAKEFASESEPAAGAVASVDPIEAAGNMAVSLLKVAEGACKAFVDSRLMLDEKELESGRESLAPVIDKYGLALGSGKMPYAEEIEAGFYLGGLWRRFRRALGELKAADKAAAKEREQANGGQRKYEPEKPARAVPSEVGLREKPNTNSEGWNSENWGAGDPLGQQQGSSGAPI